MAAKQVILYFDNPADALRFTLAACSALAGEGQAPLSAARGDITHEIKHATRIVAENLALAGPE
jgi:hypothetical protein